MKKILLFLSLVLTAVFFTACDDDNEYLLDDPAQLTPKIVLDEATALIQTQQGMDIRIKAALSNPSGLASVTFACEGLSIEDNITVSGNTYSLDKAYTIPAGVHAGIYVATLTANSLNTLTVSRDIKILVDMLDNEVPKIILLTDLTKTYPAEFDLSATLTDNVGLTRLEVICEGEPSVNYTEELSGLNRFDFVRTVRLPYSYPSRQLELTLRLTDLAGLTTEETYTLQVNVYPEKLFIVGNASDAGWTTKDAVELTQTADGVFSGIVKLKAGGEWKFIANNGVDTWDPAWGPGDGSDAAAGTLDGTPGGSNIPAPATDGFYKVTADFTTMTYKVEKMEALDNLPTLYLIGNPNGWENPEEGIWSSSEKIFPVFRDDNALTNGVYTYTGFFKKEGDGCYFKFCPEEFLGSWNYMYCNGANGVLTNGNKDAFSVPGDTYYTVNINLLHMTWEIVPLTEAPVEYTKIGLMGVYNGWNEAEEAFMTQSSYDKHLWRTELQLPAGVIKFRAESDWNIAWGGGTAPYGKGDRASDSGNIDIPEAGTYTIYFNDITGHYIFLKQ